MKVRKPMRLEEELIDLVELHGEGNNFTAKMEFILHDYFNTLDERRNELDRINNRIEERQQEFSDWRFKVQESKSKFEDVVREILYSA